MRGEERKGKGKGIDCDAVCGALCNGDTLSIVFDNGVCDGNSGDDDGEGSYGRD